MKRFGKIALILALLLTPIVAVHAQTTQGEIAGTARDAQGAAVPGVTVSATNVGTGLSRTSPTADNGTFRFPALPTGVYELTADGKKQLGAEESRWHSVSLAINRVLREA